MPNVSLMNDSSKLDLWRKQCSPLLASEKEAFEYHQTHPQCAHLIYLVPGVLMPAFQEDKRYPHVKITSINSTVYQQQYELMEAINAENGDNGVVLLHDNFSYREYSSTVLDEFLKNAVNHSYILPITGTNVALFDLLFNTKGDCKLVNQILATLKRQLTETLGDQIEESPEGRELSTPKYQGATIFSKQQIDLYQKMRRYSDIKQDKSAHLFFESDSLDVTRVEAFQSIKRSILLENGLNVAIFVNSNKHPVANDILFDPYSVLSCVLQEYTKRDLNSPAELERKAKQEEALNKIAKSGKHFLCAAHFHGEKPSLLGPYDLRAIQCKNELYSVFSRTNPYYQSREQWPAYYEVMYLINGQSAPKPEAERMKLRWDIFAESEQLNNHLVDDSDPTWEWGIKVEQIDDELRAMIQPFNNIAVLTKPETATHALYLTDAYFKLLTYCHQIRSLKTLDTPERLQQAVHECECFVKKQLHEGNLYTVPREVIAAITEHGANKNHPNNYEALNSEYYKNYVHPFLINSFLLSLGRDIFFYFSRAKTASFLDHFNIREELFSRKIYISTYATLDNARNAVMYKGIESNSLFISLKTFSTVFSDMVKNQASYFYNLNFHEAIIQFIARLEAASPSWGEQQTPCPDDAFVEALRLLEKGSLVGNLTSSSSSKNTASFFYHQDVHDAPIQQSSLNIQANPTN